MSGPHERSVIDYRWDASLLAPYRRQRRGGATGLNGAAHTVSGLLLGEAPSGRRDYHVYLRRRGILADCDQRGTGTRNPRLVRGCRVVGGMGSHYSQEWPASLSRAAQSIRRRPRSSAILKPTSVIFSSTNHSSQKYQSEKTLENPSGMPILSIEPSG
jgi:hypothetical protein